ncbi:hypothetical protein FG386_002887 [Cryptosporidium ryanae]|uniref:uncharacterized protein n=1 Tax=Cryptosporidium ryanae TaxID=515981 RepID=UPI003519F43C|nr:hypothetical protein FG386_002887 [Cryptosporidium ryanae]
MRKQSSMLHLPRGSRGESFSIGHSISTSFTKFTSKYVAGGVGGPGLKQENQGLWQDILKSCLKNKDMNKAEDFYGTVFVMGRANSGKSELIEELKRMGERDREKTKEQRTGVNNESYLASNLASEKIPYMGLYYSSIRVSSDILREKEDGDLDENSSSDDNELDDSKTVATRKATIDIWSIDHCEMSDEIVKRLVSILNGQSTDTHPGINNNNNVIDENQARDSLDVGDEEAGASISSISGEDLISLRSPNVMFLIVLDGSLPWTLNDDFSTWIQEIQSIWMRSLEDSKLSPQLQNVMIREISHYFDTLCSDGVGIGDKRKTEDINSENNSKNESEESNQDGDESRSIELYPKVNLGIPIAVVIAKSDVGKRFTVPTGISGVPLIPFALSFLMSIGDSYGMSYFVTSVENSWDIHQSFGVSVLLRYLLHRLFGVPFRDEEGAKIDPLNKVITANNSIICVLPKTNLKSLPLDTVIDVDKLVYEELVQKSNYSAISSENKDRNLDHGLSTAFDRNILSLNSFLDSIKSQVPEIESFSPSTIGIGASVNAGSADGGSVQYSPTSGTSTVVDEDGKQSTGEQQTSVGNLKNSSPLSVPASQRLKSAKSTLGQGNSNTSTGGGDPSLKGFFQSLIQRGEKKGTQSNRSSLKPAPSSANLRKDLPSAKSNEQLTNARSTVAEKKSESQESASVDNDKKEVAELGSSSADNSGGSNKINGEGDVPEGRDNAENSQES